MSGEATGRTSAQTKKTRRSQQAAVVPSLHPAAGVGAFGKVFSGRWETNTVAVKMLQSALDPSSMKKVTYFISPVRRRRRTERIKRTSTHLLRLRA